MRRISVDELLKRRTIDRRQYTLLKFLRHYRKARSNRDLSLVLGIAINIVTPRMLELREAGFVIQDGTFYDEETKKTVKIWKAA